ncbi:MAG: ParB/RepB/Spo0J family partition protein [Actinomycetia bacterium]|nr:ParB/RepB/Spo0J family partition protein [Actinomycetes bacterium]
MGDRLDDLLGLTGREVDGVDRRPTSERGRLTFEEVPIDSIEANRLQPRVRFDDDELASLSASIAEVGVLQPLLIRRVDESRYELIAGERRWRAARRAGLTDVPAVIRQVDDRASLEQAVVENLHRSDLNGVEEAAAYRQLIDEFAMTQEEVARRVGKSRSAVANILRLLQLPAAVQRLITSGVLSAGHARALLAFPDPATQIELAERVVENELSVREVEDLVRAASRAGKQPGRDPSPEPARSRSASMLEIERLLGERLDTRVTVSMGRGRGRGRLIVEFADLDDLDRIYRELDQG